MCVLSLDRGVVCVVIGACCLCGNWVGLVIVLFCKYVLSTD